MKNLALILSLILLIGGAHGQIGKKFKNKLNSLKSQNKEVELNIELSDHLGKSQIEIVNEVSGMKYARYAWESNKWVRTTAKGQERFYEIVNNDNQFEKLVQKYKGKDWDYFPEEAPIPMYFQWTAWDESSKTLILFYKSFRVELVDYGAHLKASEWTFGDLYCGNPKDLKAYKEKGEVYNELRSYVSSIKGSADVALAEKKAKDIAEAKAHREKYSIKGKSVKKIEAYFPDYKGVGNNSSLYINIVAHLSNGEKISVNDSGEGYLDDYLVTWKGADVKRNAQNQATIGNFSNGIPNDQITVTVKSKYSDVSTEAKLNMMYNTGATISLNGRDAPAGTNGVHGQNADPILIRIGKTKNKATGEELLGYAVYLLNPNSLKESLVGFYKMKSDITMTVYGHGGNATGGIFHSGGQGGNGGNGGNGAIVKVYVDPAVGSNYKLAVHNNGGYSGRAGGGTYDGRPGTPGAKGTLEFTTQKVTLPN